MRRILQRLPLRFYAWFEAIGFALRTGWSLPYSSQSQMNIGKELAFRFSNDRSAFNPDCTPIRSTDSSSKFWRPDFIRFLIQILIAISDWTGNTERWLRAERNSLADGHWNGQPCPNREQILALPEKQRTQGVSCWREREVNRFAIKQSVFTLRSHTFEWFMTGTVMQLLTKHTGNLQRWTVRFSVCNGCSATCLTKKVLQHPSLLKLQWLAEQPGEAHWSSWLGLKINFTNS